VTIQNIQQTRNTVLIKINIKIDTHQLSYISLHNLAKMTYIQHGKKLTFVDPIFAVKHLLMHPTSNHSTCFLYNASLPSCFIDNLGNGHFPTKPKADTPTLQV